MVQGSKQARRTSRGATVRPGAKNELLRAKIELVAARELGESGVLGRLLLAYPAQVAELTEFSASLIATTSYEAETPTTEVDAVAERARVRAFAAVFPAQVTSATAAVAAASLQALRKARNLTPRALANRLGLGVDVLSSLERGLIRAASVPERLLHALGDALGTSSEQVQSVLQAQAMSLPALLRSTEGGSKSTAALPELDFAQAVHLSPNMTEEQKAAWLGE